MFHLHAIAATSTRHRSLRERAKENTRGPTPWTEAALPAPKTSAPTLASAVRGPASEAQLLVASKRGRGTERTNTTRSRAGAAGLRRLRRRRLRRSTNARAGRADDAPRLRFTRYLLHDTDCYSDSHVDSLQAARSRGSSSSSEGFPGRSRAATTSSTTPNSFASSAVKYVSRSMTLSIASTSLPVWLT